MIGMEAVKQLLVALGCHIAKLLMLHS